uniref:U59-Liphistoxin-Lsp1b_1 n=1 Tax=Liphistius sp. SGP-2016 TaxID=1905180 RepID=A0A4Q8K6A4_9ARAC
MKTLAVILVVAVVVAVSHGKAFDKNCAEGEVFKTCGTACPDTCENYQDTMRICTLQCVIGCQCETGRVLRKDGRCVYTDEC